MCSTFFQVAHDSVQAQPPGQEGKGDGACPVGGGTAHVGRQVAGDPVMHPVVVHEEGRQAPENWPDLRSRWLPG